MVESTLQKKFFLRKSVKKGNNEQSHKCIRKTLFLRSIVALFLPIFQRLEDELQKTLAEFQEKVSIVFEKSDVTTSPDYVFCFRLASLLVDFEQLYDLCELHKSCFKLLSNGWFQGGYTNIDQLCLLREKITSNPVLVVTNWQLSMTNE